ncbi:MAG: MFS transporter [Chloroflexota bacterium]
MRQFLIIWYGQALSFLGSALVQFALIWYLTTSTESAYVLATASVVGLLPQIFLGSIAGTLVDRWNRRIVLIVADSAIAVTTILLALCFQVDWVPLWLIYLAMFVRSLGTAFHTPAIVASTPLLVSEKDLIRVAGMNQGLKGVSNIVTPAVAALLLEWWSIQGILVIDVATAIAAITPLLFIDIPNPIRGELSGQNQLHSEPFENDRSRDNPSVLDGLKAGIGYVWGWTGLSLVFGVGFVFNMFLTPALMLVPIMFDQAFERGALLLAFAQASWGIGIILGGALLGLWSGFNNRMVTFLIGKLILGLGFLIFGLTSPTKSMMLMVGLCLSAMASSISLGIFFAMLQSTIPNEIQGRVFSLHWSMSSAMIPLGLVIAAPVADNIGVQMWFTIGGIVMIVLSAISFFVPAILHLEKERKPSI